jgi:alpha-tubulin suppressor-like RCC1 family protein
MLAVKTNGTLWGWGDSGNGQLGLGAAPVSYSSPKQIGALTTWQNVSGAAANSSAIKTDGTVWTWGNNAQGQLGLGNTTSYSSPKQVGALTTWSTMGASDFSYTAVKTDGTLWSWGYNGTGALGLNNTTDYSSPKQVGSNTNWSSLPSGNSVQFVLATAST